MIYLLGVLMVTVVTGDYLSGFAASFFSVMLLNFFFTTPTYTFVISQSADLIPLLFFLITAMISGAVMSLLRRQRELAQNNEKTTRLLYEFAGGFMHVNGEAAIVQEGDRQHPGAHRLRKRGAPGRRRLLRQPGC